MGQVNLEDEHRDPQLERRFLAALSREPSLYWELNPWEELFSEYAEDFTARKEAIENEADPPGAPKDCTPAADAEAALKRLKELWQRRELAALLDAGYDRLNDPDDLPAAVLEDMEEEAAQIRSEVQSGSAGTLRENEDVVSEVLEEAKEAREHYQATGDPIRGVKTGIGRLDQITGGLQEGLTILSGGPGTGKTTLALQVASDAAAEGVPVLYVTFENSPRQLARKGMGRVGDVNPRAIRRGTVPLKQTRAAAKKWDEKARRITYVEGRSDLGPGQIHVKARRLLAQHDTDRCLVVVDYLQNYAKAYEKLNDSDGLRERVEWMGQRLRELSMQLRSPVVAISSQSRSAGYSGGGSADLDTLKESGDLEYGADVVAILTEPDDRQATDPAEPVDLTVAKNRNGETGRVELIFRPDRATMRPESYHDEAPGPPGGDGLAPKDSQF